MRHFLRLLTSLLLPVLLTVAMTSAEALSSVTLPISVPVAGLQVAANAHVPQEFARIDQTQTFLGGLLSVQLTGTVTKAGEVTVKTTDHALLVSVPIRADFHAAPTGIGTGLGSGLARDFGGAATIELRLTPSLSPQWDAGASVTGTYTWTDPLSVELTPGVKINVQTLADAQVRAQLEKVSADLSRAVREGANLRQRAGTLWAKVQQPWSLPTPQPAYALVRPVGVSVSPFTFTPDALTLTVTSSFDLRAGLGQAPPVTSAALPALKLAPPQASRVDLSLPLALPYPELSRLATEYASRQGVTLPLPTSPSVHVLKVDVKPAGTKLLATVQAQVRGPLGLKVNALVDVSGTPTLQQGGKVVTLSGVTVRTRREGLSGKIIGLLADARAQAYLSRAAHFDLTPHLEKARLQAQARLPLNPVPGVQLSGVVGPLKLTALGVQPGALVVTAAASGTLSASVDAASLP